MGYDAQGRCPMLRDGGCSIYRDRPQTCRTYDCRIFAATGLMPEQPEIAARVEQWEFSYANEASRDAHSRLRDTAVLLAKKGRRPPVHVALEALRT